MSKKYQNLKGTIINGVVKPRGNGACVIVPKKWLGKEVEVKLKKERN